MDSAWLIDFLTLAETGSFSRAADRRNLTQPAFSRRIRALEDWIGASLFDRSIVPVTLTDPGRQFLPEARKLIEGIQAAQRIVRAAARLGETSLSVATTDALAARLAPLLFSRLVEAGAGGLVNVTAGLPADIEAMLMRGQCQILLQHHHADVPARVDGPDVMRKAVARDLLVAVGAPSVATRLNDATMPTKVAVLAHDDRTLFGQIFSATLAPRMVGIDLDICYVSQSAALLHTMALLGSGVAWLPLSLIRDDLLGDRLQAITSHPWCEPVDVVLTRNRTSGSAALEAFWTNATSLDERQFDFSELPGHAGPRP